MTGNDDLVAHLRRREIARLNAALASRDKEIERLTKERDDAKRLLDLTREHVKPMLHRWNIERQDGGDVLVCQNNHEKGDKCEYERWVPEALAATATRERDVIQATLDKAVARYLRAEQDFLDDAADLRRERDEARAECERLRKFTEEVIREDQHFPLSPVTGQRMTQSFDGRFAQAARAALHPEGAKDGAE